MYNDGEFDNGDPYMYQEPDSTAVPLKPRYWKAPAKSTSYVWYALEGDKQEENYLPREYSWGDKTPCKPGLYEGRACFADITYHGLSEGVNVIKITQPFNTIAYSEQEIRRWISDINEVGFPCSIVECGPETLKVHINVSDYQKEEHLVSTLYLLRVLWEAGRNLVVEEYLKAMDKKPKADKIIEIQKAHKLNKTYNGGHTGIISHTDAKNLTREEVFENFEKLGLPIYRKLEQNVNVNVPRAWGRPQIKGYA